MSPEELRLSLLYDGDHYQPPAGPTHIASWQSLEPSSSSTPLPRRIALAYPDNTIWITSVPETSEAALPNTSARASPSLPQLVVPSTFTSAGGSRTPTTSRFTRPVIPRSSSFAGRHRATSSASSILSSSSRRRSSALSPPPVSIPLATVSATTALADPLAGHDHRNSTDKELLEHLREQRGPTSQDDSRLGLGIGGLGRRGLSGVHSKEDIAQQDGAISPGSSKSMESSRTISTRLMGWIGDDKGDKDRKELMERVQEVEVEREMLREVEEDRREAEEERLIEGARRTPVGTPKMSEEGRGLGVGVRARDVRVVLGEAGRGRIVRIRAEVEWGVLMVLRDIGILDIVSLVTLEVVESIDLETPEASPKLHLRLSPFWNWRGIHVVSQVEEPLILLHGLPWPCALPSPNGEVTRVVMLRRGKAGALEIVSRLELPGEGDIGAVAKGSESSILHSTPSGLRSYAITSPAILSSLTPASTVNSRGPQSRSVSAAHPATSPSIQSSSLVPGEMGQLRKTKSTVQLRDAADQPLPYPPEQKERERSLAKFLAQRRGDREGKGRPLEVVVGWGVGEGKDVEVEGGEGWASMELVEGGPGGGCGERGVDVFGFDGDKVEIQQHLDLVHAGELIIMDGGSLLCLRSETVTRVYRKSAEGDVANEPKWEEAYRADSKQAVCSGGSSDILFAKDTGLDSLELAEGAEQRRLMTFQRFADRRAVSVITPYNVDNCFVADSVGNVSKRKLSEVLSGTTSEASESLSSDRLEARVTCMKVIPSQPAYLVAGDEDGIVRIWDAETFELQGSWTLFAFPVQTITLLDSPQFGSLNNRVLCTSQAGTVGLISLTEMEHLFLIPASRVPLRRVYIGGKDIMLAYANGKARVWNYETQEFRRSTGLDAAEDMLNSGEWTLVGIDDTGGANALSPVVCSLPVQTDLGRLLQLDIRQLCDFLQNSKTGMSTSPLGTLRTILSALIPFGVEPELDRICEAELGITPPAGRIALGRSGLDSSCTIAQAAGADVWRTSAKLTGTLQLGIVTMLRMFLDSPDHERAAAQLIAYFTASLPEDSILAGLPFFASFYLDPIPDIHQAARMLFGCQMDAMSEADFEAVVDAHLPELPSFLPSADQHLKAADLALTMLGGMALHKYQSMAPGALKAIAESIVIYLNSTITSHLSLAIELASKGFTTWQAFVDPAEMLRRLFMLSTQSSPSSGSQISAQARLAVLHVASSNPALFMSTLSMDILDAKSVEGRKSIMKLCVYMARKKPEVLENSLPKIVEAVVKSLDPNVGKMREDVQQTATVILNELVLAFSTIDFNSTTQKLAVGTHEGALIMYDLKTASRLYILEPHKHPVSAVNFSPDGRRLITVSLEEGGLTVWKIGSSLSGFFNVGGPPRQGGKPGEPFKRIEFARADNVPLDSTSALSDVQISWPGPRQAKVLIKETAMTFET